MILEDGKPLRRPLPWRISDYLWGIFPALASLFAAVALWQYGHAQLGAMLIPAPETVFARAANILADGAVHVSGNSESEIANSLQKAKDLIASMSSENNAMAAAVAKLDSMARTR